jgi:hypothetical protein
VDGQLLHRRVQSGPIGHGPGFQRAANLQAQIVVQTPGVVTLDAEETSLLSRNRGCGLGRLGEAALASVFVKRQKEVVPSKSLS